MLRRLVPGAFVLSGVAGLILQVAWFRLLALSLGSTLAATSAVLSAFMAGLALGAWFFGRRARAIGNPLRTYALLEVAAGVSAVVTLPLVANLHVLDRALAGPLADWPTAALAVKLLLAGACLLPATFFMGGTLPVLCQELARRPETAGTSTGGLYALNTWGAVGGTILVAFVLLHRVGLTGSVLIAAGLDLAIAAVVLVAGRLEASRASSPAPPTRSAAADAPMAPTPAAQSAGRHAAASPAPSPALARRLTILLALVGAAGLGYEVLWTRVLAFYFGSGAQAFALVLAVVLGGLACGAFLGGWLADRTGRPLLVLAGSQAAVAVAILHQVWRFPVLPDFLYDLALRFDGRLSFADLSLVLLTGAVQLLLPATVAMGAALPAAARALVTGEGEAGGIVGRLFAANAFGTIPGAIAAALVLIPLLGTQGSLLALAALNLTVAAVACWPAEGVALGSLAGSLAGSRAGSRAASFAAVAGIVVVAVVGVVVEPQRVFSGSGALGSGRSEERLIRLEESAHGTLSLTMVDDSRGTWKSLSVDGVNVAGTSPPLLSCQALQGHLPLMLHEDPKRVLHVGFGSGGTAAAVATHPGVESIEIAEINPDVLRFAEEEFREVNFGVLDDPRISRRLVDGRNWVFATDHEYDVILSDSIHPRYRGNSSLYTVDYFEACRERLAPGGVVSTWLPIYGLSQDSLGSIVASMRAVFPATSVWYLNSTINEFVILIGRSEAGPLPIDRFRDALGNDAVAASLERVGVRSPEEILDFFVAEGEDLDSLVDGAPLNRDDRPWVELESATILNRNASWWVNLERVIAARHPVGPLLPEHEAALRERMTRYHEATTHALAGHLALLGGDGDRARQAFALARRINPSDAEPWEFFGSPPWVRARTLGEEPSS